MFAKSAYYLITKTIGYRKLASANCKTQNAVIYSYPYTFRVAFLRESAIAPEVVRSAEQKYVSFSRYLVVCRVRYHRRHNSSPGVNIAEYSWDSREEEPQVSPGARRKVALVDASFIGE